MTGFWTFNYTQCRVEELFLYPGTYLFEVWGAGSSYCSSNHVRGLGGYSREVLTLREKTKVFIRFGGRGM